MILEPHERFGEWELVLRFDSDIGPTVWVHEHDRGAIEGQSFRVDLSPSAFREELVQAFLAWREGGFSRRPLLPPLGNQPMSVVDRAHWEQTLGHPDIEAVQRGWERRRALETASEPQFPRGIRRRS